ncbi:hypothetical protein EJB05_11241, partial [Eragrostis curvula]
MKPQLPRKMRAERAAARQDVVVCFPMARQREKDVLVVCSSTGWTDEKHMLYLRLLEESFVSQLHAGECSYKAFDCSPRSFRRIESAKQIVRYEYADQGGLEIGEDAQAKSCVKVERVESPCGSQKDERVLSMDDNASTSDPVDEATPQTRATSSGQSSKCNSGKHRHSPSRSRGRLFHPQKRNSSKWAALMQMTKTVITMMAPKRCMLDYQMEKPGLSPARVVKQKDNSGSTNYSLKLTFT